MGGDGKLSQKNKIGIRHNRKGGLVAGHPFARVIGLDRWLVQKMLQVAGNPSLCICLWDGREVTSCAEPAAKLTIHDRAALLKLIIDPELHFGDLYSSGRVEVNGDLVQFLEVIYRRLRETGKAGLLRRFIIWWGHRKIANSLSKARDNIYHHYDIGNPFYEMWLDKEVMQYTCAYFYDLAITLEEAQLAKLHHVCRKLQLKPGDTVVEAGCGWGGLARFMARHYGVNVKAYNISHEQVKFAREKAEQEGLSHQVEFVEDDYRNITGQYDVFVSVGMLEHVGTRDYRLLGEVINRCLKPDGRALIHTIGRNKAGPMNAWIERRIFPGAYPPTLREMMDIFEPYRFSVLDVENLRLHYAKTLEHWLQRYDQHVDAVEEMMDAAFVRAWRLYLAGSFAAFAIGELQLFQVVFTRARNNQLPWSRAHLYREEISPGGKHEAG
ncbi:MAG: class I SAM-dependent methyltransferase [Halobacteria archaeon]|nr:class I SAM-dependent methyltransferase [Halobacteria archaeon]